MNEPPDLAAPLIERLQKEKQERLEQYERERLRKEEKHK